MEQRLRKIYVFKKLLKRKKEEDEWMLEVNLIESLETIILKVLSLKLKDLE